LPTNFKHVLVKNLSPVLNVILLIAVAVLYFFHFSGNSEAENPTESVDMAKVDSLSQSLKITYVNTDSIWGNYKLVADKLEVLESERIKAERKVGNKTSSLESQLGEMMQELQSKAAALESNMATMNESIRNLRLQELQDMETNARNFQMNAEQEVMTLREKLATELMQKEAADAGQITAKIKDYLKEYNETHKFTYILAYAEGGGILLGDEALEITSDVIGELNRRYDTENPPAEEGVDD
jgi:outer membrane protein